MLWSEQSELLMGALLRAPHLEGDENFESDLLNHVLLPRFLPQMRDRKLYDHGVELLQRMVDLIGVEDELIPISTIEMMRTLNKIQTNCVPEAISEEINALTPGKTFAMFVKRQNCAIVIYMPPQEINEPNEETTLIVATFHGSYSPKLVNETVDDFEV